MTDQLDPRDMTPRQIAEALGGEGDVSATVRNDGSGVSGNWHWSSPADFARIVEQRKRKTEADVLAADILAAQGQMGMYMPTSRDVPTEKMEFHGLLLRIGDMVMRGVRLPEWQQAKPAAPPAEEPPLTVAEAVEWCGQNGEYLRVNTCGQIFTGPASDPEMRNIPELTAIVRGKAVGNG